MRATSEEIAIFVAVVESGVSAGRPSARTGQLRRQPGGQKLESKLGVSLLNRTTRQLSLTEEGASYFRRMRWSAGNGGRERSAGDAHDAAGPAAGRCRDAGDAAFSHAAGEAISRRYPEMTLSLVSSETFINLIERKVDAAIRAGTLTDSSLRARPLFTSYRKIVASPDYVARYGMPQPIRSETASLPRLHRAGIANRPVSCCDGQLLEIEAAVSSNSGETLKQLCLTGTAVLPACRITWWIKRLPAESLSSYGR
ncbi:LysR family transcriptional regulator [Klebsiella pneumoniae]|uniref:LysR family transcriptional regulator n=1 Tax=Klebsiella pneumoniae TaxID=573 RepID=A0A939NUC9_KLEPN|nr:LysR family transcriptional regulator [Klebsiella pneumoniae]